MTSFVPVGVEVEPTRILILGHGEKMGRCLIEGKDHGAPLSLESPVDVACNPPIIGKKPKGPCSGQP